jgi:periplasmic copper chaperone A
VLQRDLVTAAATMGACCYGKLRLSSTGDRGDRRPPGRSSGRFAALAVALLLGAACGPEGPPQDPRLQITDARVRGLIPGRDTTVGYFTAHNPGPEPLVLTGARSDAVRAIEMHVTLRDGDMVRMRRLDEVVVEAGETVRFEPGGRHLMLFGATELNTPVEIVLLEQDGTAHAVPFRVLAAGDI